MDENNNKVPNFKITLEKINSNLFTGEMPDDMEVDEYYLHIESDLAPSDLDRLVTQWRLGIKIASPEIIEVVVGSALPAISLTGTVSPRTNSYERESHYFKLDMTSVYWQGINYEMQIAVYIPDSIPFKKIELLGHYTKIKKVPRSTLFTITNNLTGEEETVKVDKYTFEGPILIGSGPECDLVLESNEDSAIFAEHLLLGHMGHHTYMRTKRDENGKIPKAVNEYGHLKYEEGDRRFDWDRPFEIGHYTIQMMLVRRLPRARQFRSQD